MYPWMMPGQYNSPRDFIKALKEMEEWEEVKAKKKKENEKKPPKNKGLSTMETFLLLTLLSPVIGPLYLYAVVAAAKHIGEVLSQIH